MKRRIGDLDNPPAPYRGSPASRIARGFVQAARAAGGVARAARAARNLFGFSNNGGGGGRSRSAPPRDRGNGGPIKMLASNGDGTTRIMKHPKKKGRVAPSIKKRVKILEKKLKKQNWHKHVFKNEFGFQVSASANQCGYNTSILTNGVAIEEMISRIPYVNAGAPAATSTYDGTAVTINAKWHINVATKTVIRNNFLYPVELRCYIVKPKVQTGSIPENNVQTGITKQANPTIAAWNGIMMYPTDSEDFKANWKILKSCDMQLKSGDECIVPYSEDMVYDQEYQDVNTSTYNTKYSRLIFIRIQGVVCHDSTVTTSIGYAPAKVDGVVHRVFKLKKPSEAPLRTINQFSNLSVIGTAIVGVASAEIENAL